MKYYETTIRVTVLSEGEPLGFNSLADVHYAITDGDCVGSYAITQTTRLSPKGMADRTLDLGSEPGFFCLTEEGTPAED